ncbi:MAG: hypothetical protein C4K60_16220 [Ideonella sp. MAG2]|nr:MAG: hypothetical protein C4K60_16220 [Ideonella sp. MAG2]
MIQDQAVRTGTHVHRLGRQPQAIDADHRNTPGILAAYSTAAVAGQVTLIRVALWRSSIRMSPELRWVGSSSGTKAAADRCGLV